MKKELAMQRKVAKGNLKKAPQKTEPVVLDNAEKSARKTTEGKVQLLNQGRE